jgi:hypothetical protein
MANANLNALLDKLGIPPQPRYPLDGVAAILGLSDQAVRCQVKKGNLIAVRGSRRRWTGVLHEDLDAYYTANNVKGGE